MAYKMNVERCKEKLKLLTDSDLRTLVNMCDTEAIRRSHANTLKKASNLKIQTLGRTIVSVERDVIAKSKKPAKKKHLATKILERPTVRTLGDPDGDVLWKHHGVTESEAYDQYNELNA